MCLNNFSIPFHQTQKQKINDLGIKYVKKIYKALNFPNNDIIVNVVSPNVNS